MPLRIRPATTRDVDDLVRVINAAFVVERFFIDRDRTDVESVRARFAKGGFLVGEDATGRVVACVYTEQRGDHGYFGLLSVAPECKRRGYGRQLIDFADQEGGGVRGEAEGGVDEAMQTLIAAVASHAPVRPAGYAGVRAGQRL